MKILCISDQIDPQVYSPGIKERFGDVDLILSAGDLPLYYLDFIISILNKPLYFIFGNHHTKDLKHYTKQNEATLVQGLEESEFLGCGAVHIGSNVKTEGKFIVAGLGGCMRYNNGQNQFSDFEMFLEILKLIPKLFWNRIVKGRFLDILLTHAPPKGIHDKKDMCHLGFKSFLWFMKAFKPKFLVHGHIHLYDLADVRVTRWENTHVINAYSHYVIDLGDYNGFDRN
ncbi:MAG: metallophosphoesterase [Treponema sp.]|nr:metallophosphoesterase [Treponema sp.]